MKNFACQSFYFVLPLSLAFFLVLAPEVKAQKTPDPTAVAADAAKIDAARIKELRVAVEEQPQFDLDKVVQVLPRLFEGVAGQTYFEALSSFPPGAAGQNVHPLDLIALQQALSRHATRAFKAGETERALRALDLVVEVALTAIDLEPKSQVFYEGGANISGNLLCTMALLPTRSGTSHLKAATASIAETSARNARAMQPARDQIEKIRQSIKQFQGKRKILRDPKMADTPENLQLCRDERAGMKTELGVLKLKFAQSAREFARRD